MRILVVSPFFYPHKGGAEIYAEELFSTLLNKTPNLEVDVLTYNSESSLKTEDYRGLTIHRINCIKLVGGQFLLPNPIALARLLIKLKSRKYKYVITQTRFFDATWWAWLYAKCIGAKSIFIAHGADYVHHKNKFVEFVARLVDVTITRFSLSRYNKTVAISQSTKHFIERVFKINKVILIHGAIHTAAFSSAQESHRRVLPANEILIDDKTILISFVGRLINAKGLTELLNSYYKVTQSDNENIYHLAIGGSGPIQNNLANLIDELGINDSVSLLGELEYSQVKELLSITDVFVHPSYNEGLPRIVIEAAASGCVVVASDVGSTYEIIIDGETGVLIPAKDTAAISSAIINITQNPEHAQRMAKNAIKHVQNNFDWTITTDKFKAEVLK